MKISVVAIPPDVVGKIGDPAYQPATIPANTYTGQETAVPSVSIKNFLVAHDGVPADTVYAMTKALFTNLDQMVAAHSAAKAINAADAVKGAPVPLHPGAERYFREAGVLK
jgi:TRAP transporter TAXI family solute receptor